jgi:hypothetical protein
MKRSAILIGLLAALVASVALAPAAAQAKSRQCGTTVRHFSYGGYRFKVWVARGSVSCTTAKRVMARAFTAKAVKGWRCIDATKGGGAPKSYSDECRKGSSIVRGDLLGQASSVARAAFTGRCKDVALTEAITARVVVSRDTCTRGRAVVRHWLTAVKGGSGAPPRLQRVDGYTCVFGGRTLVVLRCTQGRRVMRATWGD